MVAFSEIASRVNVNSGGSVIVTDSSGRQVKGKLTALSSDTLTLLTDGADADLQEISKCERCGIACRTANLKAHGSACAAGRIVPAAVCASLF